MIKNTAFMSMVFETQRSGLDFMLDKDPPFY
jgi:hypothetical protein